MVVDRSGAQPPNGVYRRRRLLTWIVFASVLLSGAYAVAKHPKQYYANSTVVIVGAPTVPAAEVTRGTTIDPSTQSPLARFGNTRVVGDIFARVYQSSAKREQLAGEGLVGKLTVTTKSNIASQTPDHGPVLVFTVASHTAAAAAAGARLVTEDLQQELDARQAGFDPDLSVSMAVVSISDVGIIGSGSRLRAAVGFLALALFLGWVTGRAYEAVVARRQRRSAGVVVSA
jgi:hypothetical protein